MTLWLRRHNFAQWRGQKFWMGVLYFLSPFSSLCSAAGTRRALFFLVSFSGLLHVQIPTFSGLSHVQIPTFSGLPHVQIPTFHQHPKYKTIFYKHFPNGGVRLSKWGVRYSLFLFLWVIFITILRMEGSWTSNPSLPTPLTLHLRS